MDHMEGPKHDGESSMHVFVKFVRADKPAVVLRVNLEGVPVKGPVTREQLLGSIAREAGLDEEGLTPLHVQHRQTRIWYELRDMRDVKHNVLLEMRLPDTPGEAVRRPTSPSTDEEGGGRIVADEGLEGGREKYLLVMVGLPARGKTFIGRKVARYLNWIGVKCKVFNVGNYRRERLGAHQKPEFFDPHNAIGLSARTHMAMLAMDDMFQWLGHGGRVAIFDATNSTVERRALIRMRSLDERVHVIFLESICNDPAVVDANIRETKISSPDFVGVSPDEAAAMFKKRIAYYEEAYETVGFKGEDVSHIKLFDVGRKIEINRMPPGYLPGRIVFFLMTLHTLSRPIWLTRHGQSAANLRNVVGSDSDITDLGDLYAQALSSWVMDRVGLGDHSAGIAPKREESGAVDLQAFKVWISTLRRTKQTAQYIPKAKRALRMLDEISAGRCDGMTYEQIAQRYPDEYAARNEDKLRFRYPNGESYVDVINRLEPVIFELERSKEPILVIAHNAVIRALYGYFMDMPMDEIPFIDIPLHTVIELTPKAYGCIEFRYPLLEDGKESSSSNT